MWREAPGCRAVLLNPAVDPARDLAGAIGEQTAWHEPGRALLLRAGLRRTNCARWNSGPLARPENYFAVIAKGDEVLDWREMAGRYAGARIKLLEGSDHGLSDFDRHIDDVFAFLGLG